MTVLGVALLVIASIAMMPSAGAFFLLAHREKRAPGFVFMVELVGRWWQIPFERKDRSVSTAVVGFQVAIVAVLSGLALIVAFD